ncbi:MAG TPA: DUF5916 domain-containing protein [Terriglobales bacterium]|nr:DUF5916 domain-containing protein [Terriglobales bacterium]
MARWIVQLVGAVAACALCFPASAQVTGSPSERVAYAHHVQSPPKLDGSLSDPIWLTAKPISDFRQREPNEGEAATERTEVRILYTSREIYFGITCFESEKRHVTASELRRDVSQDFDDYFEIAIDSADDRRNAYVFQVNPLGTQRDGLITEEHGGDDSDFDPGWDGVWVSAARRTQSGWTATVAIPFSTLNLLSSTNVTLGINFKRFIRWKNEEDLWSGWRRAFGITKVSQEGVLRGIEDINSGRLLIIKPYLLGGFRNLPASAAGSGLEPGTSIEHHGGIDAKIGIRSNLVANLTLNTDFADADVDIVQFNLTPFKLFFPEKRQFFLENAGIFGFPLGGDNDLLFFSRQIGIDPITGQEVPVKGGGKLTGKLGGFDLGLMDVETRANGPNPYGNFGVARVKRSLFGDSYIGAMAVDKRSGNPADRYNQTGGIDGRFVIHRNLVLSGFAALTRSPGLSGGQNDAGASMNYHSDFVDFSAERRRIGQNFNPEVGFIERNNCLCDFDDLTLKPRPKLPHVRELQFEGFIANDPDLSGVLQTQEWQGTFRANFNSGAYTDDDIYDVITQRITTPFNIYKNVVIPNGMYHWARHQLTYGSPQNRNFNWSLFERFGAYYDGHLNEARVRGSYRASEHLSVDLSEQWNRFRLPAGTFSIVFGSIQTNYAFSRFLFLSTVLQIDTANRQAGSANIRLRWNYRPDSDLYVIYTAGQRFASLAAANPMALMEHRFAVKFTYSFSR